MAGSDPFNTDPEHRDPLTGAPGSHPVGTGVGAAAAGLAAGAGVGSFAGPVGTAVGIALGALAGGLAGKGLAEMLDPTREDAYWRDNFQGRPYVDATATYEDYGPAYRYGADSHVRHAGHSFEASEAELEHGWPHARGASRLDWQQARYAARDAWSRMRDVLAQDDAPSTPPDDGERRGK